MSGTTIEYASNAPMPLILDGQSQNSPYPSLLPHDLLADGTPDYLKLILTAKVYDILKESPLVLAVNLSNRLGNEIWLKREDLQQVFSFKIRGAYNFMANLSDEERWRGVITCSAGRSV
jgi:threonine dehydratase